MTIDPMKCHFCGEKFDGPVKLNDHIKLNHTLEITHINFINSPKSARDYLAQFKVDGEPVYSMVIDGKKIEFNTASDDEVILCVKTISEITYG